MSDGGGETDHETAMRRIVGDDHVRPATERDEVDSVRPKWVVEPGSTGEVAELLRHANANGLVVVPRGSGTKIDWGNPPTCVDVVLSTLRLNQILEHAAGDMTATVQAGCPVDAFNQLLAERGQRLAIDPLWPRQASIGGILATNDSGALRATYGSLRDHLIGATVVLADGTVARSGGKVVKNVAGYDLPKLFIGSFGTLGVIVEAVVRLYPLPRATRALHFRLDTPRLIGAAMSAAGECSSLATAIELEVGREHPTLSILIESLPEVLEEKVRRVASTIRGSGGLSIEQIEGPQTLGGRREQLFSEPLFDAPPFAEPGPCVCKVSLVPSCWPELCEVRNVAPWCVLFDTSGIGLVGTLPDPAPVTALRETASRLGGAVTVLHGPASLKRQINLWPDVGDTLPLMRRVKEQFDPKRTLSPGRFVGGI